MNTKIKLYILIVAIVIGIIIMSGALYFTTRDYKNATNEDSQKQSYTPTPETQVNREAREKIEYLQKESLAQPGNTENLAEQASAYYLLEKYEQAITTYKTAIELTPDNASLYFGLGNAYLQHEEIEAAINAYEKAIELDEAGVQSYIQLASIYDNRLPNKAKVIESYTRGIQANPNNTSIRILLASFYEQIEEQELALQQYRSILAIDPENSIAKSKLQEPSQYPRDSDSMN